MSILIAVIIFILAYLVGHVYTLKGCKEDSQKIFNTGIIGFIMAGIALVGVVVLLNL